VPGYLDEEKTLRSLGIDEVIIYCVNDGAVMDAWAENQGVDQSAAGLLTMMGDPSGALTRSLGMVLNHPGPMAVLGYERCKRFALYLVDGVVKVERIAEASDDPAGDDRPDVTLAPAMIEAIKAFGKDEL